VSDLRDRSGASFISPVVQCERIAAWCLRYITRLPHVFEELDESGGRADPFTDASGSPPASSIS
jgi:hypothetical protein